MMQPPDQMVRDTIAAIIRHRAYDRSTRNMLWERVVSWVADLLGRWFRFLGESQGTQRFALVVLVVAVAALLARIAWVLYATRLQEGTLRMRARGASGGAHGGWEAAQALAAQGRYTEAAHELYAGLLELLAREERVRLHPAKTVGDYARELRAAPSPRFPVFRDFARSYEVVVYGMTGCDQGRWERLLALAARLAEPRR